MQMNHPNGCKGVIILIQILIMNSNHFPQISVMWNGRSGLILSHTSYQLPMHNLNIRIMET